MPTFARQKGGSSIGVNDCLNGCEKGGPFQTMRDPKRDPKSGLDHMVLKG
jgi:hypothetical protein